MSSFSNGAADGTPRAALRGSALKEGDRIVSQLDIDQLLVAVRRQSRVILYSVLAALSLGSIYLITAVPKYTATVDVLIDSHKGEDQLSGTIAELTLDTGAIDSQVEVMKSDSVALGVVKALSLDTDDAFSRSQGSILGAVFRFFWGIIDIKNWFTSSAVNELDARQQARDSAVQVLKSNLSVRRVGKTYVLSISYTSPDRRQAQAIANAFADAYFTDQLDARYLIARRAAGWLNDRIAELKDNSLRTDLAVQRFKAEKGILSTGGTESTHPANLVEDQQLVEMTSQLSQAHNDTARMEARLQQINDIIKSGRTNAAVTESLGSPVITNLREKFLRASKTAAELTEKLGADHYQVVSLRNEMAQYERLIFEELKRFAQTYSSDLEVARAREKNLNDSMSVLVSQKAVSNETMVMLRELEREAEVFKNLYQTFLQRYQDTIQRQSFPNSEARVITPASLPGAPSSPNGRLVLLLSGLLGLLAGGSIGAYREAKDRVFRVAQQVRDELGLDLIGMLAIGTDEAIPVAQENLGARNVRLSSSLMRHAIDAPLSGFAETLRSAKVEVDLTLSKKRGPKIIGIISVLPGEGKTTVSKNWASLLSFLGRKTLLIDGDMRNPGLTRGLARHASVGLLEVLRGERTLQDAVLIEPETGLCILPVILKKKLLLSSELISSQAMGDLLEEAGNRFEYILVDLPPFGPVVDVRAAAGLFDAFLLVVEWGKTARSVVKNALMEDDTIYDKCIGVVFNKVNAEKLQRYNTPGSKSYYYKKYGYYYTDTATPSAGSK